MLAGVGMHISRSLGSAPNRDLASMGAAGVGVLFASMLALAGGGLALGRRRSASVLLLISAALCGLAFLRDLVILELLLRQHLLFVLLHIDDGHTLRA